MSKKNKNVRIALNGYKKDNTPKVVATPLPPFNPENKGYT